MRPEQMHSQFMELLEGFLAKTSLQEDSEDEHDISLSETQMFELWNVLGEELGIDLSLASSEQRRILFEACQNGRRLSPKQFGSLLWLMYYAEPHVQ